MTKSARTLECPKCGAPADVLARACSFCNVPLVPTEEVIEEDRVAQRLKREAFVEALATMLARGSSARDALHAASAAHLDAALDEGVVNATLAIARSFDLATKCSTAADASALCRIVDAYEKARADVQKGGAGEISLPFLSAGPTGPQHLNLALTTASLATFEASR